MLMLLGELISSFAILALLIAALGVARLPDALSRQHAVTKAATVAVSLFALGLALVALASGWGDGWGGAWLWRLGLLVLILLVTLPLASHALAQAGAAETAAKSALAEPTCARSGSGAISPRSTSPAR